MSRSLHLCKMSNLDSSVPAVRGTQQSSSHLWPSHTAAASCCLSCRLIMFSVCQCLHKKKKTTKTVQRVVYCVVDSAAAHLLSNCKNLFPNQHFTRSCCSLQFQLGPGFLVRLLANKRRSSPPSVPPSFPRLTSAYQRRRFPVLCRHLIGPSAISPSARGSLSFLVASGASALRLLRHLICSPTHERHSCQRHSTLPLPTSDTSPPLPSHTHTVMHWLAEAPDIDLNIPEQGPVISE